MQRSAYTRAQINKLWEELAGLPARIQATKENIVDAQKKRAEFERSLDELFRAKLNPGKQVNVALTARINVLTLPHEIEKLNAEIKPHDDKLAELKPALTTVEAVLKPIDARIENLKSAIGLWQAREILKQKLVARDECLRAIHACQRDLDAICPQRDAAHRNEREAKTSLDALRCELENVREARARRERERREQEERERQAREQAQYASNAQSPDGYSSSAQIPAPVYSSSTQIPEPADDSILLTKIADLEAEVRRYHQDTCRLDADVARVERNLGELDGNHKNLERECVDLNDSINNLRNKLRGFSYVDDLRSLQDLLRGESKKRAPHAIRRQELVDEIDSHTKDKKSLELQRDRLKYRLEESRPLTAQFSDHHDVADLEKQLQAGVKARKELKVERDRLRKDIADKKQQAATGQDELTKMIKRQKVLESDNFLITFRDRPAEMLTRMFDALTRELPAFDYAHPGALHERVRICLISLQNKANFIMRNVVKIGDPADSYRCQFAQLCGLLWEARAQTLNDSKPFTAMMDRILGSDVIEEADARSAYKLLKSANHEVLRDYTGQDLAQHEIQQFEAASQRFEEALARKPDRDDRALRRFFSNGHDLLNSIRDDRARVQQMRGMVGFNYRLHTEILSTATAMLGNPENEALHLRLQALAANDISGKPSVAKKVFGAIMMFIGGAAALIGGLILAGVLPIIAPPATVPCIAAGATLIASGFGLFAGGAALLAHGRTKQTAKAINQFDQSGATAASHGRRESGYQVIPSEVYRQPDDSQRAGMPEPSAPPLFT